MDDLDGPIGAAIHREISGQIRAGLTDPASFMTGMVMATFLAVEHPEAARTLLAWLRERIIIGPLASDAERELRGHINDLLEGIERAKPTRPN